MSFPTEIIPGVFVGDMFTASNLKFFQDNKIYKVVNCTPDIPFHFPWVKYHRISLLDSSNKINNDIMAAHIPLTIQFILQDKPSRDSGVLIHCHAGISRSCTVAVGLLRTCCATSLPQATAMLLSKRPQAFFNGTVMNFQQALISVFGR